MWYYWVAYFNACSKTHVVRWAGNSSTGKPQGVTNLQIHWFQYLNRGRWKKCTKKLHGFKVPVLGKDVCVVSELHLFVGCFSVQFVLISLINGWLTQEDISISACHLCITSVQYVCSAVSGVFPCLFFFFF